MAEVKIYPWIDALAGYYAQYGVPWRVVPFSGFWPATRSNMALSVLKYVTALRKERLDLIISYCMVANLLGGIVWRWVGARGFIWNQVDEGRERRPGRWEALAVRRASCFISNCTHGADFLHQQLSAPREKIHVIYNGVSPEPAEKTVAEWRRELEVGHGVLLACMIANLTSFKDHATLLQAWRKVVDAVAAKGQRAVLLLAGRFGDQHIPLKLLAYDLDLGRSVRFLGQVKDITGLIRATDLCVFSSRLEGCPNAVCESMGEGLAVAGTDIPGIREAVGSAGEEFLAPPGNADQLAEKILHLLLHPEIRARAGRANQLRVRASFSVEKMCGETVALLQGVAAGPGSCVARALPRLLA